MAAAALASPAGLAVLGGLAAALAVHRERVADVLRALRQRLRGGGKQDAAVQLTDDQLELLKGNEKLFDKKGLGLLQMLMEEGQRHVCAFWAPAGTKDAEKKALVQQLLAADSTYPGGLRAYIRNAKQLLEASKRGLNPFEGCRVSVPEGETLSTADTETLERCERNGVRTAANCAFVLVAGGLGERLGYNGIKVSLPTETATGTPFLGLYIAYILALQRRSSATKPLPLAIMTSDDTHDATLELLKHRDYFGATPKQVTLMRQGKVPCLADNAGHLAMDEHDPYRLLLKPHGHGDVHSLLHSTGIASKWAQGGFKWVAFFQDTNALSFRGLVPSLGVSAENAWHMNSLCVPRFAKEAIGAICRLEQPKGGAMTVNVEYNQLDPLLRDSGYPNGDVNDESGFSPFPGNINQIVIKLEPYVRQLEETGGVIAEFVNPKYRDATRTAFKKPTRLECMMQDYPKSLPRTEAVGFTTYAQVGEMYSPVKNSAADARKAAEAGAPTHSATTGEFDLYRAHAAALQRAGCAVEARGEQCFNGLKVDASAQIVLMPSFAVTSAQLRERLLAPEKVKITGRSSLILAGDVTIESLELNGALEVVAEPGTQAHIKRLVVRNDGWTLDAVDEASDEPEYLRIRGFRTTKGHGCRFWIRKGTAQLDAEEVDDVSYVITNGKIKVAPQGQSVPVLR